MSGWLHDMTRQHKSDLTRARYIARAASTAGEPGAAVVLEILQEHQQDRDIVFCGCRAVEHLPASDRRVELFADVILNEPSWSRTTWPVPLLRHFEEGITQQNAPTADRAALLQDPRGHRQATAVCGCSGLTFLAPWQT